MNRSDDNLLRRRDPVTFEVIRGGLYAICEEMKSVMTRAAFSPLLSLSSDLSCALLDRDGEVVAQGNDIPVHLGSMPFTGRGVLSVFPTERWRPGDAVLTNDPYLGGNHLPDMTLMSAIFAGDSLLGFSASRVHWPDIGGIAAGSSSVTDHALKEGIRVPPVKVVHGGRFDDGVLDLLLANVRVPDDRMGDFKAQYACNLRGVERVGGLAARYGPDVVAQAFRESQPYSQLQVEAALREIPDGVYRAEDHIDGDGYSDCRSGDDFLVRVAIEKRGAAMTCDFTGTAPAVRGPANAPLAVTASACYYTLLTLAGGEVPPNSGAYRPLRLVAPPGTLVNATYPSPVVSANTETSTRLVDLLFQALAGAVPDRAVAGTCGSANVLTIGGFDSLRGRPFVNYETIGGGMGASAAGPGLSGFRVHMGNTMNLPVEALENALPVEIREYALIDDSGGAGRHGGGMGSRRVMRALIDGIEFSLLSERSFRPAPGIAGGGPGRPSRYAVRRADGSEEVLSSKTPAAILNKDDELWLETAAGGGWGEPADDDD